MRVYAVFATFGTTDFHHLQFEDKQQAAHYQALMQARNVPPEDMHRRFLEARK